MPVCTWILYRKDIQSRLAEKYSATEIEART